MDIFKIIGRPPRKHDLDIVSIKSRPQLISHFRDVMKQMRMTDGQSACVDENNTLLNTFKLLERIGSGSKNGEAMKLCYPLKCTGNECTCSKRSTSLALKRIPITDKRILKYALNPTSYKALQNEVWAELTCMKLCNFLVEQNVTPNLPLYVNYFVCDSCVYENEELQRNNGSSCIILINELATEGDLAVWSKTPRSPAEWYNAYFQIFCGLYALQKYFDITHHDLHWGNVLVHKTQPGGYWRYTIDNRVYDVPNLGYMFVLWDFGYARIPNKMEISELRSYHRKTSQNPRLLVDYKRISYAPYWRSTNDELMIPVSKEVNVFMDGIEQFYKEGATLKEILSIFKTIYAPSSKHEILDDYSLDKNISVPREYKTFLRDIKLPLASRRPSLEEITMSNILKKLERNTFMPTRKKVRNLLTHISKTPAFNEIVTLAAENYPPPPVTDITYPNGRVSLSEEMISVLLALDKKYRNLCPDFVDEFFRSLNYGFTTRSVWARFINWLLLMNESSDVIQVLLEPVEDYFIHLRRQLIKKSPKMRSKPSSDEYSAYDLRNYVDELLQGIQMIREEERNGKLSYDDAMEQANDLFKYIFDIFNKIEPMIMGDMDMLSNVSKQELILFAIMITSAVDPDERLDTEVFQEATDQKQNRLKVLLALLTLMVTYMQSPKATRDLVYTTMAYQIRYEQDER